MKFFYLICSLAMLTPNDDPFSDAPERSAAKSNVEQREIAKTEVMGRVNWAKLAIDPSPWIDREVTMVGWLDFEPHQTGKVPHAVHIYESREALQFALSSKSISCIPQEILQACANKELDSEATLGALRGKLISISGKLDYPIYGPFSLASLKGDLKIIILRKQTIDGMPESLLERQSETFPRK